MSDTADPSIYLAPPVKGSGPAVIVLPGDRAHADAASGLCDVLAEEGYLALSPTTETFAADPAVLIGWARNHPDHKGGVSIIAFADDAQGAWDCIGGGIADVAVIYGDAAFADTARHGPVPAAPITLHLPGDVPDDALKALLDLAETHVNLTVFAYPDTTTGFALPGTPAHDPQNSAMAYSRTVCALKVVMGPHHNLEELWEYHLACEFRDRDAEAAMQTMVPEPYVNHVPTLTGGVGYKMLKRFYSDHFVNQVPGDRRSIPISRTIGPDRIVDEKIFCFTHDSEIDWMLPGVPPTRKYVEIPLIGIVSFRGDKLVNEHIYWDQASVLVQIGLLDPTGLPVSGREQARKLLDPSLPSNEMMPQWAAPAPDRES
jgi:carboxymethylenebutenolidase